MAGNYRNPQPPASRLGPITDAERGAVIAASDMRAKYETKLDRESAYEILTRRAEEAAKAAQAAEEEEARQETAEREYRTARRYSGTRVSRSSSRSRGNDSIGSALAGALVKELKGTTGRRIVRGILGGLFKAR